MSVDDVNDSIQGQVFVFADDVVLGNRVFKVDAIRPWWLREGVDIGGKMGIAERTQLDRLAISLLGV